MKESRYEIVVVGNGLFGSSLANQLSSKGVATALVGPEEPRSLTAKTNVFSSHYDQARIYRVLDPDLFRARLALKSIIEFTNLENRSGIQFCSEIGHICFFEDTEINQQDFTSACSNMKSLGVKFEILDSGVLHRSIPSLCLESGKALLQSNLAGTVNPRRFIEANNVISKAAGALHVLDFVKKISRTDHGIICHTGDGNEIVGDRAVLAPGAFLDSIDLSDFNLQRPIYDVRETPYSLFEVDPSEAHNLKDMPTLIYKAKNLTDRFYLVPPVEYPDGRHFIKIGPSLPTNNLSSLADIRKWYRKKIGESRLKQTHEKMHSLLIKALPSLKILSGETKPCVTTITPHKRPYMSSLSDRRLFCMFGGNAFSAKCALELGMIASEFLLGNTSQDGFDLSDFACLYQ